MHIYTRFALSFRSWHRRMTPEGSDQWGACAALTMFELLNLFSLSLGLALFVPNWLYMSLLAACGVSIYVVNRRILDAYPAPPHARWSDNVPGLGEYPAVYSYLFLSFALLAACILVRTS
ncbi:hypothetical protein [Lysobacter niastensis]|uniref:Uncharacterized protein n=1 Tax=Lysobacter niastensis TaxID=380629 RepID=A0ABS0B6J7_9GAMM|nr:hypothetical protein [Lysobacter niastensis]MBF6023302.1 hypothetical protein [Lysobacter niastensis]